MGPLETLETPRLTGERVRLEDVGTWCGLFRDPDVGATMGGVRSVAAVARGIGRQIDHWNYHGFGYWSFRDAASNRFVGAGGLRWVHAGGERAVELGYSLKPEFWGKGLATEMGAAALRVAFDGIGLPQVIAFTLITNARSRRVMEKLGFRFEREFRWANLPHVLYRRKIVDDPPPRRARPSGPVR